MAATRLQLTGSGGLGYNVKLKHLMMRYCHYLKHDNLYCYKRLISLSKKSVRIGECLAIWNLFSAEVRNVPYGNPLCEVSAGAKPAQSIMDRFSRRLSHNPAPALISFRGFSPSSFCGGESYLVMSQNLKREIWSPEIPAFQNGKPFITLPHLVFE